MAAGQLAAGRMEFADRLTRQSADGGSTRAAGAVGGRAAVGGWAAVGGRDSRPLVGWDLRIDLRRQLADEAVRGPPGQVAAEGAGVCG